ncbi:MAG: hypothetical protein R2715_22310 [Ilumatobacteraceae bacterium]
MLQAAAVRAEHGRRFDAPVTAYGESYRDQQPRSGMRTWLSTTEHVITEALAAAGLPTLRRCARRHLGISSSTTNFALSRTGRDVGTPIITFHRDGSTDSAGPRSLSFFGPVISRVPSPEDSVRLWDAVTTLAEFPGFAEMKRSLREAPQLTILGSKPEPVEEDWQGGHRRGHLPGDRAAESE